MRIRWQVAALMAAGSALWGQAPAQAQSLGTFSWQLQPFCNVVTVNVVQTGAVYTLDGYDDQCGAAQRAPLVGLATPNPDGTIGFGLHIVTAPGGLPVHVDARISLGSFGGPWTDSAGNSGTLVLGGSAAGSARPVPTTPGILPGSITTISIADGTIGAADINTAEVQRRITGPCPRGWYMVSAGASGSPSCTAGTGTTTVLGVEAAATTVGARNIAVGYQALGANVASTDNTAVGSQALRNMNPGAMSSGNTAVGSGSMFAATSGFWNTALGNLSLQSAVDGASNTAVGRLALMSVVTGSGNTAIGNNAGFSTTGGGNIAIGTTAPAAVTTGNSNIHVGNARRFGRQRYDQDRLAGTHTTAFIAGIRGVTTATAAIPVLVSTTGQLGTVSSSRRYKFDIADMDDFSGRMAKLRPVTFRYKQPMSDGSTPLDFGLIAEEVAEVFPELAVTGADGQIETVAYHKLPALLLNELQKLQRVVEAQSRELADLRAAIATASRR